MTALRKSFPHDISSAVGWARRVAVCNATVLSRSCISRWRREPMRLWHGSVYSASLHLHPVESSWSGHDSSLRHYPINAGPMLSGGPAYTAHGTLVLRCALGCVGSRGRTPASFPDLLDFAEAFKTSSELFVLLSPNRRLAKHVLQTRLALFCRICDD